MGWEHRGYCTQKAADHMSSMTQWPGWELAVLWLGRMHTYSVRHTIRKPGWNPQVTLGRHLFL